jgi:DNA replication protein DnaC
MPCERCDDSGWVPTVAEGVRRVVRCACWREDMTQRRLAAARIPPRYQRCSLETFIAYDNDKLQRAVAIARRFAEQFPVVPKGFCFIGPTGIGKTHLAVGVLRQAILGGGATGLFYTSRELLREIRSTYNPVSRTAEIDILRPVMEAHLLVLDDLGSEKPSEWVEETLNLIVDTRYNHRRATIVTTNFQRLEDEDDPNGLKARVGFRIYSRLYEMCDVWEFDGADFRKLPANSDAKELRTYWHATKGLVDSGTPPPRSSFHRPPTRRFPR